jgi:hypothetical protein
MIELDGPKRHVYIKFVSNGRMATHLQTIIGSRAYRHDNGELSNVDITPIDLGYREVRIAGFTGGH